MGQVVYTIKQTARLTGVPPGTLRSWERRYAVVRPTRNESGYRVYDKSVIAAIIGLRTLIDSGWAPAEAARAIEEGKVQCSSAAATELTALPERVQDQWTAASHAFKDFLRSAARLDSLGLNDSLDRGFALGPFEHVVDYWLFPALTALGDAWASGQIDVAGEHLASQAVRSRLSGAFEAAGWRSRGPSVLVGLPPGSHHDLGALAFAVMAKRCGLDVHYLGADLPTRSWVAAVEGRRVDAAVLAVPMAQDRPAAEEALRAMQSARPDVVFAAGGAHSDNLTADVLVLPPKPSTAAEVLDERLHQAPV